MAAVFEAEAEPLAVNSIELVGFMLGFAVLLVLWAAVALLALVGRMVGHIPVIGGPIHFFTSLLFKGTNNGVAWVATHLYHYVAHVAHMAWSVMQVCWRFVYLAWAVIMTLINHVNGVDLAVNQRMDGLQHQEQTDIKAANARITDNANIEDAYIENLQTQVTDNFAYAQTYTDLGIQNLRDLENRNLNTVKVDQAKENTWLQTQITNNKTDLQTQLKADVATINTTITRDVTDLNGQIDDTKKSIPTVALQEINLTVPNLIRQLAPSLQPQIDKITTDLTECLDPLCDTVTPQAKRLGNLGKYLSGFETLAIDALLVALAAECLTHPDAVVEDVGSVVNAVGGPIVTGFRDVLGA